MAALRFARHDRLDDVLEWLGVEAHEPLRVGAPGARVFVLGGAADDKRPSVDEARRYVAEGHTLITSAECATFAAEVAPALRPEKKTAGWSTPERAGGWAKAETGWSKPAHPAADVVDERVEAPTLRWATGELEPAWVDCEHTFGGEPWVTRGGAAVVASVAVGEGRVVHLGGALLSWSPPEPSEAAEPATLGIDDPDHDGSPVDERAYRIGLTAGALLLEQILAGTE